MLWLGMHRPDSLHCSDHEVTEFKILKGGKKAKSRVQTLVFRQEDFGLFRNQLGRIPGDTVLAREVQDS